MALILEGPNQLSALRDVAVWIGLALCASAVGGLAYIVLGRPLRSIPLVGWHLAGIVSLAPYMAVGGALVSNVREGRSFFAPWTTTDLVVFAVLTVLFGSMIGHGLARAQAEAAWDQDTGSMKSP